MLMAQIDAQSVRSQFSDELPCLAGFFFYREAGKKTDGGQESQGVVAGISQCEGTLWLGDVGQIFSQMEQIYSRCGNRQAKDSACAQPVRQGEFPEIPSDKKQKDEPVDGHAGGKASAKGNLEKQQQEHSQQKKVLFLVEAFAQISQKGSQKSQSHILGDKPVFASGKGTEVVQPRCRWNLFTATEAENQGQEERIKNSLHPYFQQRAPESGLFNEKITGYQDKAVYSRHGKDINQLQNEIGTCFGN